MNCNSNMSSSVYPSLSSTLQNVVASYNISDILNQTTILKTEPYAYTSITISTVFLCSFIVYLTVFVVVLVGVKVKQSNISEDEATQDHQPPQLMKRELEVSSGRPSTIDRENVVTQPTLTGRKKHRMNKNQKVMFSAVCFLVVIQCVALSVRTISDALSITIARDATNWNGSEENSKNLFERYIAFLVFSSADLGFTYGNMITTSLVLCFVQNVFLATCNKVGALKERSFKIMVSSLNILTAVYFVVASGIMFVISLGYVLVKLSIVKDFLLAFYISCFAVNFAMIVFQTILFNANGVRVINTINKRSAKSAADQKRLCISRKYFVKIMALQFGLSFCAIFQLVALIFQSIGRVTTQNIFIVLSEVVNSTGILSFSIVVLFLYNPLLNYNESQAKPVTSKTIQRTNGPWGTSHSILSGETHSPRVTTPSMLGPQAENKNHLHVDMSPNYLSVHSSSGGDLSPTSSFVSSDSFVIAIDHEDAELDGNIRACNIIAKKIDTSPSTRNLSNEIIQDQASEIVAQTMDE